jgi:hypothetical protein
MVTAGRRARPKGSNSDDRPARALLAGTGLTLVIAAGVASGLGWWPWITVVGSLPFGALLIILSAFYSRVAGEVRCGVFSLNIASPNQRMGPGPPAGPVEIYAARGKAASPDELASAPRDAM